MAPHKVKFEAPSAESRLLLLLIPQECNPRKGLTHQINPQGVGVEINLKLLSLFGHPGLTWVASPTWVIAMHPETGAS